MVEKIKQNGNKYNGVFCSTRSLRLGLQQSETWTRFWSHLQVASIWGNPLMTPLVTLWVTNYSLEGGCSLLKYPVIQLSGSHRSNAIKNTLTMSSSNWFTGRKTCCFRLKTALIWSWRRCTETPINEHHSQNNTWRQTLIMNRIPESFEVDRVRIAPFAFWIPNWSTTHELYWSYFKDKIL